MNPPGGPPPAGWYPDPAKPGQDRYWDGSRWAEAVRQRDGAEPAAPTRRSRLMVAGAALVLVSAVAAGTAVLLDRNLRGDGSSPADDRPSASPVEASPDPPTRSEQEDELRELATEFFEVLTTWDASDGLADTLDRLREFAGGDFESEIDALFGGDLADELVAVEAVSIGEVEDVYIQRLEGDGSTVLVVGRQTLRTNMSPDPDRTVRTARIDMRRNDGRWRITAFQLLVGGHGTTGSD